MITQQRLKELLDFDPETGIFTWKVRKGRARKGDRVGQNSKQPNMLYVGIQLDNVRYYAHDLVWLWTYGHWPRVMLDHADRNGLNNRPNNLRECNRTLNQINTGLYQTNTSGFRGVYPRGNRWQARLRIGDKCVHLGMFATAEQASLARNRKAVELYGDFAVES